MKSLKIICIAEVYTHIKDQYYDIVNYYTNIQMERDKHKRTQTAITQPTIAEWLCFLYIRKFPFTKARGIITLWESSNFDFVP